MYLDTLFISLAFLLPGFLASRLISARTPVVSKKISPFEETFESLLRSVYIHLVIGPLIFLLVFLVFITGDTVLVSKIYAEGINAYYLVRPFEATLVLFLWLFLAFLLAIFFGYQWDPLEVLSKQIIDKTGVSAEDVFYQLRTIVIEKRKKGNLDAQLWVQARMKNGFSYRGEFVFMGYREEGMSRELLLTNVKFYPYSVQTKDDTGNSPKLYDYVVIDVANCDSLEILMT